MRFVFALVVFCTIDLGFVVCCLVVWLVLFVFVWLVLVVVCLYLVLSVGCGFCVIALDVIWFWGICLLVDCLGWLGLKLF